MDSYRRGKVLSAISGIGGRSRKIKITQKVFEKVSFHLIREFRQNRLDRIQKEEGKCMKKTGGSDHMGLYEAERQTQGSNCQGINVKKRLCKEKRGRGGKRRGDSKLSEDGI